LPGDPEAIGTLQEIIGYIVSGETRLEKLFFLFGPGRSGKGTIVKVLERLLGEENATSFSFRQLTDQHGREGFIGKSVLTIQDAHIDHGHHAGAVEVLKTISGNDRISIPRKYKSAWVGTLPGRILIVSNNAPRLDDDSGTIATRLIPVHLRVSFIGREDPNLLRGLLPELSGIFNWARVGWQRLIARGHFVVPASAREFIDDIRHGASPVTQFVEERCIIGPAMTVETEKLWQAWEGWTTLQQRCPCGSRQAFGRALASVLPAVGKVRGGTADRVHYYRGIGLATS
jgi:putative DNA primase/helicase